MSEGLGFQNRKAEDVLLLRCWKYWQSWSQHGWLGRAWAFPMRRVTGHGGVLLLRWWAGEGRIFPNSEIRLLFNTHSGWGPWTHLQSQMPFVILFSSLWNKWQLLICFPLPARQEMKVWSLGWEDPLEKEITTHSSILTWRIPWIEEPGRLQSMGSQRVRHNWATNTFASLSKV